MVFSYFCYQSTQRGFAFLNPAGFSISSISVKMEKISFERFRLEEKYWIKLERVSLILKHFSEFEKLSWAIIEIVNFLFVKSD